MFEAFVGGFNDVADDVHQTAVDKGWWDNDPEDAYYKMLRDSSAICLMHSELSEALEALRHNNPPDDKISEFTGVEAELADVIIRIMDFAKARKYKIAEAVVAKIEFNKSRERMHGGKKF